MTDGGPAVENDIATAQVKVVLEDIPATPSFRAQQLQAFSQVMRTAPAAYQAVLYPAMLELSDVPNRHELADQLRQVGGIAGENPGMQQMQQQSQAQLEQQQATIARLEQELQVAKQRLTDKSRELDLKERDLDIKAQKVDVDGG